MPTLASQRNTTLTLESGQIIILTGSYSTGYIAELNQLNEPQTPVQLTTKETVIDPYTTTR